MNSRRRQQQSPEEELTFKINPGVLTSYQRLAYTAWHAIAEFVDNSTQSFIDNRKVLEHHDAEESAPPLTVSITYDPKYSRGQGLLRVADNAMGMDRSDLQRALEIGLKPDEDGGRSEYGMGMKTAAFWCGKRISIETSKYGDPAKYHLELSLKDLSDGKLGIPIREVEAESDDHYTVITVTGLEHKWVGRTLGKIKQYLRSMYRVDIREGLLNLEWQGEELEWDGGDFKIREAQDGSPHRKEFTFKVKSGRKVAGWAGILEKGSRSKAGFAIIRRGRVITGWPDSYRPAAIFGDQVGGSNTLVNQRLFGEIHLDGFPVTHTMDGILFYGSDEEDIEDFLEKDLKPLIAAAKESVKGSPLEGGPSESDVRDALEGLEQEVGTEQMKDRVSLVGGVAPDEASAAFGALMKVADPEKPTFTSRIGDLDVRVWLVNDGSPNDPYVAMESTQEDRVLVTINRAHPHWLQLDGENAVLNYLRECVYDALAEWQARNQSASIEPQTVKMHKDRFLRVGFEVDAATSARGSAEAIERERDRTGTSTKKRVRPKKPR